MSDVKLYYDATEECWYVSDEVGKYGYDNHADAKEHFEDIQKEIEMDKNAKTQCNSLEHQGETWWESDARGIPLAKVCEHCVDTVLSRYRPEVLRNPNYQADEDID